MHRPSFAPRRREATVAVLLALGLAGCGGASENGVASGSTTDQGLPAGANARIDRVVDGDTVVTADGARVRLIGIDTPETVRPDSPVECYGPEASALTKQLLPRGAAVRLVFDRERFDRYDRTLAYVYRMEDGLFVNSALVEQGAARTLAIAPNTRFSDEFTNLQSQARRDARGLWGLCA